jgi:hypothetical protein
MRVEIKQTQLIKKSNDRLICLYKKYKYRSLKIYKMLFDINQLGFPIDDNIKKSIRIKIDFYTRQRCIITEELINRNILNDIIKESKLNISGDFNIRTKVWLYELVSK